MSVELRQLLPHPNLEVKIQPITVITVKISLYIGVLGTEKY